MTISVEEEWSREVKRVAEKEGRTISGLVRIAVKNYLEGRKDEPAANS